MFFEGGKKISTQKIKQKTQLLSEEDDRDHVIIFP